MRPSGVVKEHFPAFFLWRDDNEILVQPRAAELKRMKLQASHSSSLPLQLSPVLHTGTDSLSCPQHSSQ